MRIGIISGVIGLFVTLSVHAAEIRFNQKHAFA